MKSKIAFFSLLCALFALLKLRSDKERDSLRAEHYRLPVRGLDEAKRLVFLSDMHEKYFGAGQERLLAAIQACKPDAVLIGGDSVLCHKEHGSASARISKKLQALLSKQQKKAANAAAENMGAAGHKADAVDATIVLLEALKTQYPLFYAFGNHEQRLFEKALHNAQSADCAARLQAAFEGITVLNNRSVLWNGLLLSGVTLPAACFQRSLSRKKYAVDADWIRAQAGLDRLSAEERGKAACRIFLQHSPLYFAECSAAGADLVLSGHFHGGTIRIPFLGGLMTPQLQFFLPECAGLFEHQGKRMLVSRGLGTHTFNIRLNNLPEISVLELVPEETA